MVRACRAPLLDHAAKRAAARQGNSRIQPLRGREGNLQKGAGRSGVIPPASTTFAEQSGPRKALVDWALAVGKKASAHRVEGKPLPASLALQHRLADRLGGGQPHHAHA